MPKQPARFPKRDIERIILDNGVKVWTEQVPRAKTTAVGVWLDAGSRYEDQNESGSTHLIQRTAFHGTKTQSGEQISAAVESLGGEVSITTHRDHAGYLASVLSEKSGASLELLADLALQPKLDKPGIAAEQPKILDELCRAETDVNASVEALFLRSLWMGRGLCNAPQGRLLQFRTERSVYNFKPGPLQRIHRESHHPKAMTVTMSGALRHGEAQALIGKLFGELKAPERTASTFGSMTSRFVSLRNRPRSDDFGMMLGVPTCGAAEDERFAGELLEAALGGGLGSRLAMRVRRGRSPEREHASGLMLLRDTGVLWVRLKTERSAAAEVLDQTVAEMKALTADAVTDQELEAARNARLAVRSAAWKSPMTRIRDMARQERYFSRIVDAEDEARSLDEVTPEQVQRIAAEWIVPHKLSLSAIGDLNDSEIGPNALNW